MGVKEDIIKYCKTMNIDSVGFVKCRVFEELKEIYIERKISHTENEFEENDIDLKIDSEKWFEGGKTIVTVVFPYLSLYENIDNGFSVYIKAMDYLKKCEQCSICYEECYSKAINNAKRKLQESELKLLKGRIVG